ncbi:hypothetical protein CaCOL14_003825 [Colletotrichum acutatum]
MTCEYLCSESKRFQVRPRPVGTGLEEVAGVCDVRCCEMFEAEAGERDHLANISDRLAKGVCPDIFSREEFASSHIGWVLLVEVLEDDESFEAIVGTSDRVQNNMVI